MNSKQADYYAIRGFLFELLGNLNQARADWQKAERLNPIIGEGSKSRVLSTHRDRREISGHYSRQRYSSASKEHLSVDKRIAPLRRIQHDAQVLGFHRIFSIFYC